VTELRKCKLYYEDSPDYLVQYRGNFKAEIDQVSYACGDIINNTIGVVSTSEQNLDRLLKDVPSIVFIDQRWMFVLQDISPSNVDNINAIKVNPYLNLTGRGVLVGMVDTGIDYLNEEFIREDDTSRVSNIWDQTIQGGTDQSLYIGETYSNEQINNAIKTYRNKGDPYQIVPSKDEIGHGTRIAGIIGARGYSKEFQGVAPDCDFVIVKLLESFNFKNRLIGNGVQYIPIYNNAEVLAAIEYLKNFALKVKKPMVIYIGVGATEGSHDGNNLMSKYLTNIGSTRGVVSVSGVGNEGASEGHASGYIKNLGDISTVDLRIPKQIKYFSFNIWVRKPNRANLKVVSPTGEASDVIKSEANKTLKIKFVFLGTEMIVKYYDPEYFTGHQLINITFMNIKPGIWTIQLIGKYITNGRYDIWLPPEKTLPEGTKFLESDPFITLTIPSTARKVITVAYFGNDKALVASSGKGYNSNNLINPDIATIGVDVITTKVSGGITTDSGSSVATGVVVGACALLLQWGIVERNDITMYSIKIRSYLIYGADRSNVNYKYPTREIGYGNFDLLGTFNVISRSYRQNRIIDDNFIEYHINKLFIRIPK
jgi:subtilisin family serine protease